VPFAVPLATEDDGRRPCRAPIFLTQVSGLDLLGRPEVVHAGRALHEGDDDDDQDDDDEQADQPTEVAVHGVPPSSQVPPSYRLETPCVRAFTR